MDDIINVTPKQAEMLYRRNPNLTTEQAVNYEFDKVFRSGTADSLVENRSKKIVLRRCIFFAAALCIVVFAVCTAR